MKKILEITLLSDLCVSDGGVYNSMLDTDICYDSYGLPFIPARRLRGCLRECALELADWGVNIDPDILYGKADNQPSRVRIGNAVLADAEKSKEFLDQESSHPFLHPLNILNHYSYIRTQTAINRITGSADPTSLRTLRVARKGLIFNSQVEIMDNTALEQFKMCCNILCHMGVARTRGLGEVKAELKEYTQELSHTKSKQLSADLVPDADFMMIRIDLLEPLAAKSHDGGEARTMDYIEGAKVLGLIAQGLKNQGDDFLDFMSEGKLICTNAYLTIDGLRSSEVPACFYEIKNNDTEYINRLYETAVAGKEDAQEQISQMRHCYVVTLSDGSIKKKNVSVQQRYHHTRPNDKSIGRASVLEPVSGLYQISSICEGQSFTGIIRGSAAQIKTIYKLFTTNPEACMGYARMSEYGRVRINVIATDKEEECTKLTGRKFAFFLKAPSIVYNDKAFYSTDIKDLISEITASVCPEKTDADIFETEIYLNYTEAGGFNVTWGRRKPSVKAFGAGSVVVINFKKETELTIRSGLFIGERNAEGYGEMEVLKLDQREGVGRGNIIVPASIISRKALNAFKFHLANEICEDKFPAYIRKKAIQQADAFFSSQSWRPIISSMLLMHDENDTIAEIRSAVEVRYGKSLHTKQEKKEKALSILNETKERTDSILDDFCRKNDIEGYHKDIEWIRMVYLKEFLTHGKYRIRQISKEGNSNG